MLDPRTGLLSAFTNGYRMEELSVDAQYHPAELVDSSMGKLFFSHRVQAAYLLARRGSELPPIILTGGSLIQGRSHFDQSDVYRYFSTYLPA